MTSMISMTNVYPDWLPKPHSLRRPCQRLSIFSDVVKVLKRSFRFVQPKTEVSEVCIESIESIQLGLKELCLSLKTTNEATFFSSDYYEPPVNESN